MAQPRRTQPLNDFDTERLSIRHWSRTLEDAAERQKLVTDLVPVLAPVVLEHLPPAMQVAQTEEAVSRWVRDRSAESDVYLVRTIDPRSLVGLLITVTGAPSRTVPEVHIGYLLAQAAWGRGYATELIKGLLRQAHRHAPMTLIGGVARANRASAHILQTQGFSRRPNQSDDDVDIFVAFIDR
ncbi:GNAT family N-acetyltransferase [Roseivivax sp. CAU 1753]